MDVQMAQPYLVASQCDVMNLTTKTTRKNNNNNNWTHHVVIYLCIPIPVPNPSTIGVEGKSEVGSSNGMDVGLESVSPPPVEPLRGPLYQALWLITLLQCLLCTLFLKLHCPTCYSVAQVFFVYISVGKDIRLVQEKIKARTN